MIPFILPGLSRLAPYGIAVLLLIGLGAYVHQRAFNAGEAKVQALWDAHSLRQNQVITRQQAENAKLQNDYDLIRWKHDAAIKDKRAAIDRSNELAARLREHFQAARSGPLPEPASPAPGTVEPVGGVESEGGTDEALKRYDTAAQICGVNEDAWLRWWAEVSRLQQPPGALWKESAPFP
jgi:hypothetical protein